MRDPPPPHVAHVALAGSILRLQSWLGCRQPPPGPMIPLFFQTQIWNCGFPFLCDFGLSSKSTSDGELNSPYLVLSSTVCGIQGVVTADLVSGRAICWLVHSSFFTDRESSSLLTIRLIRKAPLW